MWIIVTLALSTGGAHVTLPLAIGPDRLYANAQTCRRAAHSFEPLAAAAHAKLACKFYPVDGGAKEQAF